MPGEREKNGLGRLSILDVNGQSDGRIDVGSRASYHRRQRARIAPYSGWLHNGSALALTLNATATGVLVGNETFGRVIEICKDKVWRRGRFGAHG